MFQNAISVILVSDCFVIVTCWLQVGGNTEGVAAQPDPHSYMQAYKEWRYKKTSGDTRQLGSLQDIKVCDAADTSLKPAADTSLKPASDSLKPVADTFLKPVADTSLTFWIGSGLRSWGVWWIYIPTFWVWSGDKGWGWDR